MSKAFSLYFKGKKIFKSLHYEDDAAYVVFATCNQAIVREGAHCAAVFCREVGAKRVVLIASAETLLEEVADQVLPHADVRILESSQITALLKFLAIKTNFWGRLNLRNLRIVSLDEPYGFTMQALYDSGIYSLSSLVWKTMFHYPNMRTASLGDGVEAHLAE